jgi:hypothetical protein
MAGLTYSSYVQQIATMAVVSATDPNFTIIIPSMIDYAELRIQRDLDFLSTQISNSSYSFTSNNNVLTIPTSAFIVMQTFEVINASGVSTALLPVTKEYIQNVYAGGSTAGLPQYFAVYGGDSSTTGLTSQNMIVGPTPDSSYQVRLTGTVRSAPLSATNTSTFISTYLPDMFIMASMIYISAFQRNFGRLNDDPQMAQTYESQYQALKASAMVEENRKKFEAAAWTSYSPAPAATPTRG